MTTNVIKKDWFNPITASVLVILVAISLALRVSQVVNDALFVVLLILSVLIAASIRVADQWEKAVVLRMGKFKGLKGPGPFMIIPIIDTVSNYIDQRVRALEPAHLGQQLYSSYPVLKVYLRREDYRVLVADISNLK